MIRLNNYNADQLTCQACLNPIPTNRIDCATEKCIDEQVQARIQSAMIDWDLKR